MPEPTQEEKIKIFEKLPKELQNLMQSENTGAFLIYLGEKYNLDDEKTSSLSKIVGDVILGITFLPNLVSEIISKLTIDQNTALQIVQEINTDLFAPVIALIKRTPIIPTESPTLPSTPPKTITPAAPTPSSKFQVPSPAHTDQYREPMREAPEIVDLRKTPPPPMPMPVTAAPIPPAVNKVEPPKPLTFTKPVEPPIKIKQPVASPLTSFGTNKIEPIKPMPSVPLIEAEPHKELPTASKIELPKTIMEEKPQFIIRPPGLAPTDLPHDVLDLRKDKGEF